MKIAFDIDDTMTNSSEMIIKYAKAYFKSEDEDLINNILHAKRVDRKMKEFYNRNLYNMMKNYELKPDVKATIDKLKLLGNEIYIISARGYRMKLGLEELTIQYLKEKNIHYDKIIFKARNKCEVCKMNNIDVLVDDSVDIINSLRETSTVPILFNSISNANKFIDCKRIDSWKELYKYLLDTYDHSYKKNY